MFTFLQCNIVNVMRILQSECILGISHTPVGGKLCIAGRSVLLSNSVKTSPIILFACLSRKTENQIWEKKKVGARTDGRLNGLVCVDSFDVK